MQAHANKLFYVALVLGHMTPTDLLAESKPADQLDDVFVSASRSQTKLEDMHLSTTVISREDIKNSPAQTVDQLLKNIPGINLTDVPFYATHPTGQSIGMRGLGNARALVLLDGIPLTDAFYGTVQWHKVQMSQIERIEVVRGAGANLWGNLALGGVINIVTKGVGQNISNAAASYGSQNTSTVSASKDIVFNEQYKMRLAVDHFNTDGYMLTPPSQILDKTHTVASAASTINGSATAYLAPSSDLKSVVRLGWHELHETNNSTFAPNDQYNWDLSASVTKTLDGSAKLDATAWKQNTDFETRSSKYAVASYTSTLYANPYNDVGASMVLSDQLKSLNTGIEIGTDYRKVGGSNLSTNYSNAAGTLNGTNFGDGSHTFYGIFTQAKWHSQAMPLDVTLSLREDIWQNNGTTTDTKLGNTTTNSYDTQKSMLNPNLSSRYMLSESAAIRGAAYRGFHAPGLNNMYRTFGGSTTTFSNPNLTPETLTGFEFGLDFKASHSTTKVTLFKNTINDLITTRYFSSTAEAQAKCGATTATNICGYDPNQPGASLSQNKIYTNAGKAQSKGIELENIFNINQFWSLNSNAVLTNSRILESSTEPTSVGKQIGRVSPLTAFAGLTWQPNSKLSAHLEVRGNQHRWDDNKHIYANPGYAVVNASGSYAINKSAQVFVSVVNLLDQNYIASGGSAPQSLGMPLFATVGLKTQF